MKVTYKYLLGGILFGLCFPFIALIFDLVRFSLPYSFANIVYLHEVNPIHFIIDTAPIVLGVVAYFLGLSKEKVNEQYEELVATAKYRDDFFSVMSHELRTPMNGVVGIADLMMTQKRIKGEDLEHIRIIHESSVEMVSLLNNILDLSKLQNTTVKLEEEQVDLCHLIGNVVSLFQSTAKKKGIEFVQNCSSDFPMHQKLDKGKFRQVLSNLLSNAVKFTDDGSITIKGEVLERKKNKVCCKICVIDTGQGIPKGNLQSVFKKFEEGIGGTSKDIKGTGLGLAIVKQLVALLGGEIGVESKEGEGSTFWFTFWGEEIAINSHKEDVIHLDDKEEKRELKLDKSLRVLVVDDKMTNLLVAKAILKELGCIIDLADNGKMAIEICEKKEFDLIFMDIQMPDMDGIQTTQSLRDKFEISCPIVGLSANALEGDAEKYIAQGLDDYVSKPIDLQKLHTVLVKYQA